MNTAKFAEVLLKGLDATEMPSVVDWGEAKALVNSTASLITTAFKASML